MLMNEKTLKMAGMVLTGIGFAAEIAGTLISDKETDLKMERMVNKAVDKKLKDRA